MPLVLGDRWGESWQNPAQSAQDNSARPAPWITSRSALSQERFAALSEIQDSQSSRLLRQYTDAHSTTIPRRLHNRPPPVVHSQRKVAQKRSEASSTPRQTCALHHWWQPDTSRSISSLLY